MKNTECPHYRYFGKFGKCAKRGNRDTGRMYDCKLTSLKAFDEEPEFINIDQVCLYESPYSNSYLKITKKDIDRLLSGEVLCHDDGEYTTFVAYVDEG